ncbi:MAG TPA: sulfotransferase domain-containing protein, partial [Saprospiraceae bacterium]|nr:sulfotransferase domain-containing protein [Saprospiraceae bacterium]
MIWLASFPRSGNTFTRNIFKEVFAIDSGYDDEPGWRKFPVVKTHFLPKQVSDLGEKDKVIYLVRDGRDCICSLAHHMKDIAGTGDHLIQNMVESTVAAEGSYFGGWSTHVVEWFRRADVVIRYEDLIEDPEKAFQRISAVIDLPESDWSRLPSFDKLKKDANPYGIVKEEWKKDPDIARKFYRKGRSGTWKEEMPPQVEALFRSIHGSVLAGIGYAVDGTRISEAEFQQNWKATIEGRKTSKDFRVLMEAQKLADVHHDGVFRYVHSLIKGMRRQQQIFKAFPGLNIDLLINGQIKPLFSEVAEFVPDQKRWVVQMKEKLWALYEWFPAPIKRWSVSAVNFYFYLKSRFYLWLNRKHFAAYDLLHFTLP